jgi:hypothetical protein
LAKDEHLDPSDSDATHAADEPTAVWDFEALRKAGLSEIAQLPDQPATGPATPADGTAQRRDSMIVDGENTPPVEGASPSPNSPLPPVAPSLARPAPQLSDAQGMSWIGLLTLAALCGALAYAAIRFLR